MLWQYWNVFFSVFIVIENIWIFSWKKVVNWCGLWITPSWAWHCAAGARSHSVLGIYCIVYTTSLLLFASFIVEEKPQWSCYGGVYFHNWFVSCFPVYAKASSGWPPELDSDSPLLCHRWPDYLHHPHGGTSCTYLLIVTFYDKLRGKGWQKWRNNCYSVPVLFLMRYNIKKPGDTSNDVLFFLLQSKWLFQRTPPTIILSTYHVALLCIIADAWRHKFRAAVVLFFLPLCKFVDVQGKQRESTVF